MPNVELPEEPGTGVAEDIIGRLLPEWWAKFASKNRAYGAALSRGGGLGIKAFIPEMNRKMQGIVNLVWHDEPQGQGEGAREKAMDLIGHLFIFVANLDANNEGGVLRGMEANRAIDRELGRARADRLGRVREAAQRMGAGLHQVALGTLIDEVADLPITDCPLVPHAIEHIGHRWTSKYADTQWCEGQKEG